MPFCSLYLFKVYLSNMFTGFFVVLMFLVLTLFLIYGVELFYKVWLITSTLHRSCNVVVIFCNLGKCIVHLSLDFDRNDIIIELQYKLAVFQLDLHRSSIWHTVGKCVQKKQFTGTQYVFRLIVNITECLIFSFFLLIFLFKWVETIFSLFFSMYR